MPKITRRSPPSSQVPAKKRVSVKAGAAETAAAALRQSSGNVAANKARPKQPAATSMARRKPAKPAPGTGTRPVRRWSEDEVREAFTRFARANPEPKGELEHINPFTLLVAVVLSAQATDAGVNKATRSLFAIADTPAKMIALGEERVREHIKTIGLFRTKARNVIALSQRLLADFGGEVPGNRSDLESLPGTGRKTANVVLNMAFGQPTMAVDTHVFRVGNRTGLAPGDTPLVVELELERVIPAEFMQHAHHWLILHGRYTCLARKPRCEKCLINDLCRWPEKTV